MDKNKTKIDDVIANGYYLDLGTAIEKAFENYKKIALTGGLAYLLIFLVFAGIGLSIAASLFGLADFTETITNFKVTEMGTVGLLIYVLMSIVSAGLFSPITAGFFKMAHLAENNKEFSIATVLDYYKTTYFKDLFIAASLVALINLGLTLFFEFLGYPIAGGLLNYIISFFTLFYVPLIIFGNQSAVDAIVKSIQLVTKNPFTIIFLMVIAIVGVLLGLIAVCIGILFTLPFLSSMLYTIYNEALPID